MFGALLALFVGAKTAEFANDCATVANVNRQQQEAFNQTLASGHERMRRFAEKNDLYWNALTSTCYSDYYSDGSLRYDRISNKYYKKGMYYYNCEGRGARNNSKNQYEWAPW